MKSDDQIIKVLEKLDNLASEVKILRSDMGEIKTDVNSLKIDVGTIKTDVSTLKTDASELKTSVLRLEILHEETDEIIKHIAEVVAPNLEEVKKIRNHESEQDETILFHDRRINFLEKKIA